MKRITQKQILLLSFFLSLNTLLFSQGYLKRDIIASGSIGFQHLNKSFAKKQTTKDEFKASFKGTVNVTSVKGLNPIALKYEYALSKHFGIGLSICWWTVLVNINDTYNLPNYPKTLFFTDIYNYKMSSISVGIRPNYHFPIHQKKGDLYIGCAFGFAKNDMSVTFTSTQGTGIFAGSYYDFSLPNSLYVAPTIGYRIYLANNFGLNFDLGYEKGAWLLAGVVFRFRPLKYENPK